MNTETASDESARLNPERLLYHIAATTSLETGGEFFRALIRQLALAINVRCSFITECLDDPPSEVRTLAYWDHGEFVDNLRYELAGTPCEQVIQEGHASLISEKLGERYACERGVAESYFGVPIHDANRKVIGHMAFLDDKPLPDDRLAHAAFDIFAARAGAELQRRRIEDALKASEEKYRLLVEHQTDMVVQLDAAGQVIFANPAYRESFANERDAPARHAFIDGVHLDDRAATLGALDTLRHPPYTARCEHRARTRHGWLWLAWSLTAVRQAAGRSAEIIGVGRDVTERRRAEERTRQNLQELAHAARLSAMGEMASALAHEVNQPLTSILSFSQACQRHFAIEEHVNDEVRHALARIAANAQRASDIIRHLRGFVRKTPLTRATADINRLSAAVIDLLEPELRQQRIALRQKLETPLPPVTVDPTQIQQVIFNLIRNSMEALNDDATAERVILITTGRHAAGQLALAVHDTGPGLSPHTAERIFDPFFSTKQDGLGIGLAICRSIIESHGGQLDAVPQSSGALFRFTLPVMEEGGRGET